MLNLLYSNDTVMSHLAVSLNGNRRRSKLNQYVTCPFELGPWEVQQELEPSSWKGKDTSKWELP